MGSAARNYTEKTLKRLFALSGNQCTFPQCQARLVNSKNALDSNICHIEAANVDGPRYNPSMTDEERADYENLILLCRQHHDETHDSKKYTVQILKEMKRNHESSFLHQRLRNNPSMLKNAIYALAELSFDGIHDTEKLTVYNPKQKLDYNNVKINYSLFQEYKVYHKKINSLYDELELQGSMKKEKLLNNINQIYLLVKGKYILNSENGIEIIRENSDKIIDDIFEEICNKLKDSDLFTEDIFLGVRLMMVDAFIRCKILETPA